MATNRNANTRKYPENAWDVIKDLDWKDWGIIIGVSLLLGAFFYVLPEIILWLTK